MISPASSNVFHRLPQQRELPNIVRGQGSRVFDADEAMYIDAAGGGAGVTCIGHGHPHLIDEVCRQHRELSYIYNVNYTNPQQERLASRLAAISPGDLNRVYFAQDGAEANEAALRTTRQYHLDRGEPQRDVVITQAFGYYGSTLGAMALSGLPSTRSPASDWLPQFERVVPAGYGKASSVLRAEPNVGNDITNVESIGERVGADRIAAVVTELIITAGGALNQSDAYLIKLSEWCRRVGALLIVDEVVTGIGRTGRWFCSERAGIVPDMISIGKSLGGGYAPISALLVSDRIYDTIASTSGRFMHGHSLNGNPVSCAAGNAILDVIGEEGLVERSRVVGDRIRQALSAELSDCQLVHEIRGDGTFIGLEFRYDADTFIEFERGFATLLQRECFNNGLLVSPGAMHPSRIVGDFVVLWPAFNISDTDIDEMIKRLKVAIVQASDEVLVASRRRFDH